MGAGLAYQPLAPEALAQRWLDLAAQPGLPDRWELDEYGEIVDMNPPAGPHQRIVTALLVQSRVASCRRVRAARAATVPAKHGKTSRAFGNGCARPKPC